jgi:hypothetical protein
MGGVGGGGVGVYWGGGAVERMNSNYRRIRRFILSSSNNDVEQG